MREIYNDFSTNLHCRSLLNLTLGETTPKSANIEKSIQSQTAYQTIKPAVL